MKLGLRLGWAMALLAGGLLLPARLPAQQQEEAAGETAFAGGQMVRGTVASVGADRIELKSEGGGTYAVIVTPNTRLMKERQPLKLADLRPGDGVGAMGVMDAPNRTVHAAVVFVVDAEQLRKAEADLGKTYITGKVAAIDELKLTIKRPDGVSQVIRVDEDTSFRRGRRGMAGPMGAGGGAGAGAAGGGGGNGAGGRPGGESITLADVKVGDSVFGRGGLKEGVFVPTELGVMEPGAGRGRRRGAAADGGGGAAAAGGQGAAGEAGGAAGAGTPR